MGTTDHALLFLLGAWWAQLEIGIAALHLDSTLLTVSEAWLTLYTLLGAVMRNTETWWAHRWWRLWGWCLLSSTSWRCVRSTDHAFLLLLRAWWAELKVLVAAGYLHATTPATFRDRITFHTLVRSVMLAAEARWTIRWRRRCGLLWLVMVISLRRLHGIPHRFGSTEAEA